MRLISAKNNTHWNDKAFAIELGRRLECPIFADNVIVACMVDLRLLKIRAERNSWHVGLI